MKIVKKGSAVWKGGFKDGRGAISTESGALEGHPYGFRARFEGERGTNPEELIGAAHAGCFTMALRKTLEDDGFSIGELATTAAVTLEKGEAGFSITRVVLTLKAEVPADRRARFEELANKAKVGCPVSKVLKAAIELEFA